MELIDIVDKNGNFVGKIMDKEEAHDKNLLHNGVVIFIVNDKGQVLLEKRNSNRRFNPNKWELIGGHVSAGETLEQAALREIKEEIGIDTSIRKLIPFGDKEVDMQDIASHIFYFYYFKCNFEEKDFVIQKEELSEVKWFDIDKVIEMINKKDESIVFGKPRLHLFEQLKEINH